eukprot:6183481-Pleurochrysis_carterae.AAC.1
MPPGQHSRAACKQKSSSAWAQAKSAAAELEWQSEDELSSSDDASKGESESRDSSESCADAADTEPAQQAAAYACRSPGRRPQCQRKGIDRFS